MKRRAYLLNKNRLEHTFQLWRRNVNKYMSKKGKKITLKIKYIRRNTCYLSLLILSSIHPYVLIGIGSIHIPTTLFDALNKIE